jgi:hypothetical protein
MEEKQANQHTSDPREQIMWDIYVANIAKGIENAYQAAIEAGYSEDHSRNITLQGWFKERKDKLRRKEMLSKAEKVLDRTLTLEPVDDKGEIKVDLLRVQTDVAKHITNTLGKEDYSNRTEHTGRDGKDLPTPIVNLTGIKTE